MKKHKKKIILGIVILFLLSLIYLILTMLPNSSKSLYGNRLDGIEDVKITDKDLSKIDKKLKEVEGVKEVDSDIKGRLINFNVKVDDGIDLSINDQLEPIITDSFDKEELKYYDLQLFIKNKEKTIIGYKHKTSDKFVWSNNK